MTTGMTGNSGAAWAAAKPAARRAGIFVAGGLLLWMLATPAASAAPGQAQDLAVPAGNAPAELRCPVHRYRHRGRAWRRHHSGAVVEMPGSDELAELPPLAATPHQDIALSGDDGFDGSRPLTMALWGDSHTASNFFSDEMTRSLGLSGDQVQPTFIPATMGRLGVRLPVRKFCLSDGWKHDYAYVTREDHITVAKGLGDISSHVQGSYLWVDFRAFGSTPDLEGLDVLFEPPAPGAKVQVGVSVDGGAEHVVALDPSAQGVLRITPDHPLSIVKLRLVAGKVVLQGFVPHYNTKPKLYFDTFAIPGATAHAWKVLDPDYLRNRGDGTRYDLVIMEYGTNEGNDRHFDAGKYESDLRVSLQNLRDAYPGAMCVLVGPPDRGVLIPRSRRHKHRRAARAHLDLLKYAKIHERIGEIQRAVGRDYSCAYWSWQDAMGGPGAAYNWMRRSPVLMGHDLTHLTMPGYQLSAKIFTQDIGLAALLARRPQMAKAQTAGPAAAQEATRAQSAVVMNAAPRVDSAPRKPAP